LGTIVRSIRAILDDPKCSCALPAHLKSLPQFLVGDVQVALGLLHARVAEHQLDDADVDAVGKQPVALRMLPV